MHSTQRQVEHNILQEHFSQILHFSKQKRADTEDRTFQNTVRDKSFPENDLKWHMRTHTGEKSIQCEECKQTINNTSTLTRHMRIHSRKKSFHEANPQVYAETPLHPEKLTVWCASWAGGIIGPYFFKNDEGHNVTVNGDRYRAMITNFFIPELNNHDVQEL
ncbi:uncharacterized protein TNCV_3399271 [Trichonephila clavipes]|nr:uncharacterized protein TNCV_3399271 [Trichonephila clavipes]